MPGHGAQEPSGPAVPTGTLDCGSSPVAVVVEMVITGQSKDDTESGAQGEENLGGSINPDLAGETTGWRVGRGSPGLGWGWEMPHGVPIPRRAHPMAWG